MPALDQILRWEPCGRGVPLVRPTPNAEAITLSECSFCPGRRRLAGAGRGRNVLFLRVIAPQVARDTRVCVYDRAGRGWSDSADVPQDDAQIATDLHTLLDRAHVPGPYVLAGHSFGGLYVHTFAARYPDEVAGMVLLDSTAPASDTSPPDGAASYDLMGRVSALLSASARLGLARLYGQFNYGNLPPQSRDEARATMATASHVGSTVDEYAEATSSMDEAHSLRDFDANHSSS